MDDTGVTFVTKGDKTTILSPEEFIYRFLLHVLPAGFFKIRHFGLMAASNVPTKLQTSMELLESVPSTESETLSSTIPTEEVSTPPWTWMELFHQLTGIDLSVCPQCGGKMIRSPLRHIGSTARAREPPRGNPS
jgi:hypothetical protein